MSMFWWTRLLRDPDPEAGAGGDPPVDDTPVADEEQLDQMAEMMDIPEPDAEETVEEVTPPAETPAALVVPVVEPVAQTPTPTPAIPATPATPEPPASADAAELLNTMFADPSYLPPAKPPEGTQQTPPAAPAADEPPPVISFFKSEQEFQAGFANAEAANKTLTNIYASAVQGALRGMPAIVEALVTRQVSTTAAVQDFYTKNADLLPYKPIVATVSARISAKNPGLPMDQLLIETNKAVRAILKTAVAQPAAAPAPAKGKRPALAPTSKNSARPAQAALPPSINTQEAQMEELMAAAGL